MQSFDLPFFILPYFIYFLGSWLITLKDRLFQMTLQVQNKKSNWQRREKKLYSEEMLLFMKGNIDCLVQDRTSLCSGPSSVSLPFYNSNTNSGWHLMPGVFYVPFIWEQPYEGNTIIIPILQMWKLTFREVNYLLEVRADGGGAGRQTHSNK